jgi:hypothetical protein
VGKGRQRRVSREEGDTPSSSGVALQRQLLGADRAAAEGSRKALPRSSSFSRSGVDGGAPPRSLAGLLARPTVPQMPEDPDDDPERYGKCMRLLWLAASMKSFDVVVLLLKTDEANVAMCELVGDMVPMLHFTRRRDPSPPQVLVTLSEPEQWAAVFRGMLPSPLVLPKRTAMPSLVCEVLHPAAHWSGSLERLDLEKTGDGDGDGGGDGDGDGDQPKTPAVETPPAPARRAEQPQSLGTSGGESGGSGGRRPSISGAAEAFSATKFTPSSRAPGSASPRAGRRSLSGHGEKKLGVPKEML